MDSVTCLIADLTPGRVLATKALGTLSRSAYFGPLAPLRLVELPRQPLPGPRWARVRTRLAGICGSDLHLVFIEGSLSVAPAALPGLSPAFLGHESVGEVVETGPRVTRVAVGDRVVMDGSNDCYSAELEPPCPACASGNRIVCERAHNDSGPRAVFGGWSEEFIRHESNLVRVPDAIPDEEAVLIEPAANGVRAALRGRPLAGERFLVIGAGTIGLMTVQALRAAEPGCDITASVLFERQAEEAVARGASRAIVREDPRDAAVRLAGARLYRGFGRNRTTTGGFDGVIDCVGSGRTLAAALRATRTGGRVVLVGAALAPMTIDLTPAWHQEVDIIGMRSHGVEEWRGESLPSFERVLKWMLEGRLKLAGMVTHRFPQARYRDALSVASALDKRRTWSIKVALEF
jgi:2-desacetyl-2-hydroxyethyl bacteriochlorophyllide A dehydrogenase